MKRNICIFCETWESGGIESFLSNVLLHMNREGLSVDIVTAELRSSVFTRELQSAGVRFVELSGSLYGLRENYRRFSALARERRYDVLYLNAFQGMTLYYTELARRAGVPLRIAHSHNTALRKSATRPLKLLLHEGYRRRYTDSATELWACSGQAAEFLFSPRALRERGYRFIPNGIDVERFRFQPETREQTRRELGLDGKLVIGSIGRLCYQKNQTFLLDVLSEMLKTRSDSVLLLVGEGADREALENKAKRLGVERSVIFYGTSEKVERLLCAMDAFAFPSRFEGLGIVMIEAQASGLRALCSENVPEEALATEAAQVVPLRPDAWRDALLEENRTNFDRSGGADAIRARGFDIADVAGELERRFRSA